MSRQAPLAFIVVLAHQAFGLKQTEIGMAALFKPGACGTSLAIPPIRSGLFAKHELREGHRKFELSHPVGTTHEQRMGQTPAQFGQLSQGGFYPRKNHLLTNRRDYYFKFFLHIVQ